MRKPLKIVDSLIRASMDRSSPGLRMGYSKGWIGSWSAKHGLGSSRPQELQTFRGFPLITDQSLCGAKWRTLRPQGEPSVFKTCGFDTKDFWTWSGKCGRNPREPRGSSAYKSNLQELRSPSSDGIERSLGIFTTTSKSWRRRLRRLKLNLMGIPRPPIGRKSIKPLPHTFFSSRWKKTFGAKKQP